MARILAWCRAHSTQLSVAVASIYAVVKAGMDWRHNGTPIDPATVGAAVVAILTLFAHRNSGVSQAPPR